MEITQDLTCPVCLEFYTHPIILTCGHVLCRSPCAQNILELNVLRCPVCRDNCFVHGGLSSLPRVISLESIVCKLKAVQQKTRGKADEGVKPEVTEIHPHDSREVFIPDRFPERSFSRQEKNAEPFSQFSPQFINVLTLLRNASAEIPFSIKTYCQSEEMVFSGRISTMVDSNFDTFSNTSKRAEFQSRVLSLHTLAVSEYRITNETDSEAWVREIIPPSRPITKYDLLLPSSKLFPLTAADASCEHDGSDNASMSFVPGKSFDTSDDFPTSAAFTRGRCPRDFIGAVVSRDECYFNCPSESLASPPLITTQDVKDQIEKMMSLRQELLNYKTAMNQETRDLQEILVSRCDVIISELDSLVSEIESRTRDVIDIWEEQTITPQTEANWRQLESQEDRVLRNPQEEQRNTLVEISNELSSCESPSGEISSNSSPEVPEKPLVDISMCSRNSHTVVLAIAPPTPFDVIDFYEVLFGTREQKHLKMEETLIAQRSPESQGGHSFIMIENLCKNTHYFISVSAVNKWGRGPSSELIQCSTLDLVDTNLTAPAILESLSYASISSATVVTPPSSHLQETTPGFYGSRLILYRREADLGKPHAWSGIRLQDGVSRPEVVGLTPDTEYQFRVMSCGGVGRCQLSEKLLLRTGSD